MIREKFEFTVGREVSQETKKFLEYMYININMPGFSTDFYDFIAKICEIARKDQK